jgi:phenylalanyl-tRNA synthetase beta chain
MKVPLSWLKDFVDIDGISIDELSSKLTLAGLEVEEIQFIGLDKPAGERHDYKPTGFSWDKEKIVVGEVLEVNPHPDADKLVLCKLNDGQQEHIVLTGAPNLYDYKDKGVLEPSLKVAYAKEGAVLRDAYADEWKTTKLKKTKIRGVESYSMICSERELDISEEHEGIIILPEDAPVGAPLADYLGDAVLDIAITPNIARNANILGVAREVSAIFDLELKKPNYDFLAEGGSIEEKVSLEIKDPEANPRFVLGLIENVEVKPSPALIQHRLNMIGQRPIDNVVDVTNYVMFETGQPMHAFDYDVLVERAGGKAPTIITRKAHPGETLVTLDGEERKLEEFTVLVCDTKGSHSIAGIMGGAETEVNGNTKNVLLEGATWNYINIRKSLGYLRMHSEASYRFSRGVHPAIAERGVCRGLELMREWTGGTVCKGLVDEYPLKPKDPVAKISTAEISRVLGVDLSAEQIAHILEKLEFGVSVKGDVVRAETPDHRLDIDADPIIAKADLLEEISRIYGFDKIPETRMEDVLPPQRGNPELDFEEKARDILVNVGLYEVITYRLTSPEREERRLPPGTEADKKPYVEIENPIADDRYVMRKSALASVLEIVEHNLKVRDRVAVFELGNVFMESEDGELPDEKKELVIALTGPRAEKDWDSGEIGNMDFYDLKGILGSFLKALHIQDFDVLPHSYPSFHPGKSAAIKLKDKLLGVFGELHPEVQQQLELGETPVLAAVLLTDELQKLSPILFNTEFVSPFPPVIEDIALIVDENLPASDVEKMIIQTGGKTLKTVKLFDVFRGEQIGHGKKSLAYNLIYQADDRTLTDKEIAKLRNKIVKRIERELGAQLRS